MSHPKIRKRKHMREARQILKRLDDSSLIRNLNRGQALLAVAALLDVTVANAREHGAIDAGFLHFVLFDVCRQLAVLYKLFPDSQLRTFVEDLGELTETNPPCWLLVRLREGKFVTPEEVFGFLKPMAAKLRELAGPEAIAADFAGLSRIREN